MRLILFLFLGPLLLFACALLMLAIPLPGRLPPPFSHERNLPAAIIIGLLGLVFVISLAGLVINKFTRPGRLLDEAMALIGLNGSPAMLFGRQYDGEWQGRKLHIQFVPGRLNYAVLHVHLAASGEGQAAIGRKRPLLDCRDCPTVIITDLDLQGFTAVAESPDWFDTLLADPERRDALIHLFEHYRALNVTDLYFQPGHIWLYAHPVAMPPEEAAYWLTDLATLAEKYR